MSIKTNIFSKYLYNDLVINKFINFLMKEGKKDRMIKIFIKCLLFIKYLFGLNPIYFFKFAILQKTYPLRVIPELQGKKTIYNIKILSLKKQLNESIKHLCKQILYYKEDNKLKFWQVILLVILNHSLKNKERKKIKNKKLHNNIILKKIKKIKNKHTLYNNISSKYINILIKLQRKIRAIKILYYSKTNFNNLRDLTHTSILNKVYSKYMSIYNMIYKLYLTNLSYIRQSKQTQYIFNYIIKKNMKRKNKFFFKKKKNFISKKNKPFSKNRKNFILKKNKPFFKTKKNFIFRKKKIYIFRKKKIYTQNKINFLKNKLIIKKNFNKTKNAVNIKNKVLFSNIKNYYLNLFKFKYFNKFKYLKKIIIYIFYLSNNKNINKKKHNNLYRLLYFLMFYYKKMKINNKKKIKNKKIKNKYGKNIKIRNKYEKIKRIRNKYRKIKSRYGKVRNRYEKIRSKKIKTKYRKMKNKILNRKIKMKLKNKKKKLIKTEVPSRIRTNLYYKTLLNKILIQIESEKKTNIFLETREAENLSNKHEEAQRFHDFYDKKYRKRDIFLTYRYRSDRHNRE